MFRENGTVSRREILAAAGALGLGVSSQAVRAGETGRNTERANSAASPPTIYRATDPAIPTIGLRWAFSARVIFADRFTINAPLPRGYVSVKEGEVWGPRLQGRVLPHSGADYFKGTFNTYYAYEAADSAIIFVHNRGSKRRFASEPAPGQDPVPDPNGDPQGSGGWIRFRVTPMFTAPNGPHDWMNHTVLVANATKHPNPDHTVFTFYEVL